MVVLGLLFASALVGCERYEPKSTLQQAEQYYRQKYNCDARVVDSHDLGSYALLGYSFSGSEYIMSDGCSVIYTDANGEFSDNKQEKEIKDAMFAYVQERLQSIDGALTDVEVEAIGLPPIQDTYSGEGICWHTRYDGDAEAFLKEEHPLLQLAYHKSGSSVEEGSFSYQMAYDAAASQGLEDAYVELGQYFDISHISLLVVDRQAYEEHAEAEDLTLFDDAVHYVVSFEEKDEGGFEAKRLKPSFIRIANGIEVSSATPNITLEDGDINLRSRAFGLVSWDLSEAANKKIGYNSMRYYVRNTTDDWIIWVTGLDQFRTICEPHQFANDAPFSNGDTLFIGNKNDILPQLEITEINNDILRAKYHTVFKESIRDVKLTVIGMGYKDDNISSESTLFPSRIVEEAKDGWLLEVEIPKNAVPNNTLNFQMTYNNDKTISTQVRKDVQL